MFTMLGFVEAILFFLDYFKSYVIKNPAYLNAGGCRPGRIISQCISRYLL